MRLLSRRHVLRVARGSAEPKSVLSVRCGASSFSFRHDHAAILSECFFELNWARRGSGMDFGCRVSVTWEALTKTWRKIWRRLRPGSGSSRTKETALLIATAGSEHYLLGSIKFGRRCNKNSDTPLVFIAC